jgi:hypothetical protein
MFKLSDKPSKDEYKANKGNDVLLGKVEVRVLLESVDTKSGSWERGFKFGSVTYGILRKTHLSSKRPFTHHEFSCDHGATWHPTVALAKKSKGKVIVERSTPRGEFAFSSIQRINREYDSGYKWKP